MAQNGNPTGGNPTGGNPGPGGNRRRNFRHFGPSNSTGSSEGEAEGRRPQHVDFREEAKGESLGEPLSDNRQVNRQDHRDSQPKGTHEARDNRDRRENQGGRSSSQQSRPLTQPGQPRQGSKEQKPRQGSPDPARNRQQNQQQNQHLASPVESAIPVNTATALPGKPPVVREPRENRGRRDQNRDQNSNPSRDQKQPLETAETRDGKEVLDSRDSRDRASKPSGERFNAQRWEKKIRSEETFDDIHKENERIEKEIWLDIAAVHTIKLDF